MKARGRPTKKQSLDRAEKVAWEKFNREYRPYQPTAEESLAWLDGVRAFMFEVWKKNPPLRRRYEKLRE